MTAKAQTAKPALQEPAPEQLPQAGGSYLRQPDGALLPAPATPTPAPADTNPTEQE